MTPVPNPLYDQMMETPGPSIVLSVERTEEAIQRDGPGAMISKEAFDGLVNQMMTWVGTRMMRRTNLLGKGTSKIEVELRVKIDGEDISGEPVRLTPIDGSHRGPG